MSKAKAKEAEAEEAVAAERSGPTDITALEASGVSAGDVKKLQAAGMYSVEAVAYSTKKVRLKGGKKLLRQDERRECVAQD